MSPEITSHRPSPLQIPELFEAILLHMDHRTLLVSAQRVSRHWHDLISTSLLLQRRLFFTADPEAKEPSFNPLLRRRFRPCFEGPFDKVIASEASLEALRSIVSRDENQYENASWRRMLPRQPPLYGIVCMTRWAWHTPQPYQTSRAPYHAGSSMQIRMGDLIEVIRVQDFFRGMADEEFWDDELGIRHGMHVFWPPFEAPRPGTPIHRVLEKHAIGQIALKERDICVGFWCGPRDLLA
ncbi:hypothetical protein F5Y15DRAFT_62483 [Xylariaceae sp. FL0016]|nr:hypothetical protein F5Y15DRAFT_62483 [Xylariaceae sp. FL0016]